MAATRGTHIRRIIPFLITLCVLGVPAQAQYGGGSGTANDPYQIWTPEQMNAIGAEPNDWDSDFKLMADIDMADLDPNTIKPIGGSEGPFWDDRPFTGVFDGNGFLISNFRYSSAERDGIGLFGVLEPKTEDSKGESGIIRNLHLVAVELVGGSRVGGLVGLNCGTVDSCSVAGQVFGQSSVGGLVGENRGLVISCEFSAFVFGGGYVGGLVGTNYQWEPSVIGPPPIIGLLPGTEIHLPGADGTIISCHCTIGVEGTSAVGGLVGFSNGTIHSCDSHGRVSGAGYVGGLVGLNGPATILDEGRFEIMSSYSDANVWGEHDVGGLVGINCDGAVTACYAMGDVRAQRCAGGLVGSNQIVDMGPIGITSCYATGRVYAERCAGGLVGQNMSAIVTSYSTGAVTGDDNVGGLVGQDLLGCVLLSYWDIQASGVTVSAGGHGRISKQLKLAETFKGWGHDGQWVIMEGDNYPRLRWQKAPGDPIVDDPNRYGGGTGDPNDPYQIWTAAQFAEIGWYPTDLDKCFSLMADVNLADPDPNARRPIRPIGTVYAPFTGEFEGNGHTITGFTCYAPTDNFVGVFGSIGRSEEDWNDVGLVRNLGLTDLSVIGHGCVGGLAGTNDGQVRCCAVDGDVAGYEWVGGLFGWVGWHPGLGTVFSCHSAGRVFGQRGVGGFAGGNSSFIGQSYATATVDGAELAGGFVGAYNIFWHVKACFWDVTVSQIVVDGAVGNPGSDSNEVEGCETAQMQQAVTFTDVGWDFVGETANGTEDIWWILEGQDYPRLWWEPADDDSPAE